MSPTIFVPGVLPETQLPGAHPKAALVAESGARLTLPLAPPLGRDGLAPRYSTFERVGRKSTMARAGYELKVYSVELLLAGRGPGGFDHQVSVEADLATLRTMASSGDRIRWEGYGPSETGWYRITALAEKDLRRQHGTNEITQAQVTLTLTEVVEAIAHVGPVTGGVTPGAAAPTAAAPPKTYTVVKGDTATGIAIKVYKDASKWRVLADANKITSPTKQLTPGRVLTVP